MLSVLRFFTGLGIAGEFSGTTALTGDYTPQRLRATMIMVTFTGAPAVRYGLRTANRTTVGHFLL